MPDDHSKPEGFGDLPIQPTGSGVRDLEIAYEQMRLSDDARETAADAAAEPAIDAAASPTEGGTDVADSEAHPS